ncbi:hypothetical protein BD413DRAFT_224372 [Trametes elegans]|nr:hypothetical protein BD413DRAFT_224372 [Trametes elegans]
MHFPTPEPPCQILDLVGIIAPHRIPALGPSTRSQKGSRTEGANGENAERGKDAEFWLEHGNVILIAQRTSFRVYRVQLSAQFMVFRDVFTSSTSEANGNFEGHPVVLLSDSSQDLRQLLRVIMPSGG